MPYEKMTLEVENGIATLTLNNPEKLNAMSTPMWHDMRKLLVDVKGNDEIKVFVITFQLEQL